MAEKNYGADTIRVFHDVYMSVADCGIWDENNKSSFSHRGIGGISSCCGVIFVQKGGITAVVKNSLLKLCEGDAVIFFPGELENISFSHDSYLVRYVAFNGYAVPEILSQCGLSSSEIYYGADTATVSDAMSRIAFAFGRNSSRIRVNSLLLHLLSELCDGGEEKSCRNRSDISCLDKISNTRKLMDTEYRNARKISEYAGLCSMSSGRFSAVFERAVGKTPKKYIEDIKIDRARELLTHTAMSITAAAQSSGFTDSLYFSRVFKRKFGISPSEYRKTAFGNSRIAES